MDMHEYDWIYKDMHGYAWICMDTEKCAPSELHTELSLSNYLRCSVAEIRLRV